jgi:hypothetical protein
MITPTEIQQKAARSYLPFLQSWLRNEPFFPYTLPAGSPSPDFVQFRTEVETLHRFAKERRSYGYSLISQFKRMRQYGDQNLPVRIVIETQQDFLRLIEKAHEFENFQQDVLLIRARMPQLEEWLSRCPSRVIEQHGDWHDLLLVCTYFLGHPRPNLYIRELPIPIHTKFIEQHRGILRDLLKLLLPIDAIQPDAPTFEQQFGLREDEPLVRIRLLNNQLFKRNALSVTDISLPCSQFATIDLQGQTCIVTENKMTFLTLPSLPDTFAIFGGGFMVHNLSTIPWLSTCPILYWGDIDAHGFQILSLLRSTFPHVVSLMMDETTLHTFQEFQVAGTPTSTQYLSHLTSEEHTLFEYLAQENIRLEQERISQSYAVKRIHEASQH